MQTPRTSCISSGPTPQTSAYAEAYATNARDHAPMGTSGGPTCQGRIDTAKQVFTPSSTRFSRDTYQDYRREGTRRHPLQRQPLNTGADPSALVLPWIGSHDIAAESWDCDLCFPWWYGWHCNVCHKSVPLRWTQKNHFGMCEQSCGCCRSRNWEDFGSGCESCEALIYIMRCSRHCRVVVSAYDGL